jgi:hypothetical protein
VVNAGDSTHNLATASTVKTNTFGKYPDFNNDCQQAIQAALDVQNQGTRFYAVGYGIETDGCLPTGDDSKYFKGRDSSLDPDIKANTALNVPIDDLSKLTPCNVMRDMASKPDTENSEWYFYAEGQSISAGCADSEHTTKSLSDIFPSIAATFTKPRLISNDAKIDQ